MTTNKTVLRPTPEYASFLMEIIHCHQATYKSYKIWYTTYYANVYCHTFCNQQSYGMCFDNEHLSWDKVWTPLFMCTPDIVYNIVRKHILTGLRLSACHPKIPSMTLNT